jgi:arabinan endo-1,5-alpha-L-arabinosidase
MNGNRWLGPGHNAVFTDTAGNDWMLYHAVDSAKPFFWGSWTRRPLLMDPIVWIEGWPRLRGGAGPSDALSTVPALSSTAGTPTPQNAPQDVPGALLAQYSDEFNTEMNPWQWYWLRRPADAAYGVADGELRIDTQDGALQVGRHDASVLAESAPAGDYLVETRLLLNLPSHGQFNYVQAGLVIYGDDDNFIKLVSVAINHTRQIEFGKQMTPLVAGEPEYGGAFSASAQPVVYLRNRQLRCERHMRVCSRSAMRVWRRRVKMLRMLSGSSSGEGIHANVVEERRETRAAHGDEAYLRGAAERVRPCSAAFPVHAIVTGVGRIRVGSTKSSSSALRDT